MLFFEYFIIDKCNKNIIYNNIHNFYDYEDNPVNYVIGIPVDNFSIYKKKLSIKYEEIEFERINVNNIPIIYYNIPYTDLMKIFNIYLFKKIYNKYESVFLFPKKLDNTFYIMRNVKGIFIRNVAQKKTTEKMTFGYSRSTESINQPTDVYIVEPLPQCNSNSPQQTAGKSKLKPTQERYKNRIVYIGPRGGKYIKMHKKFISLKSLQKQKGKK